MFEIKLKKQAVKYYNKCTGKAFIKIDNALEGLKTWQGNIEKIEGYKDRYKLKIPPYRIIFTHVKGNIIIDVIRIGTRGDIYKKGD